MTLHARLSHVSLRSADAGAARRFYEDHVGLRHVDESSDGAVRMALGLGAHVLELRAGGDGIDHFALEIPEAEDLIELERRLARHGVHAAWIEPSGDHPPALAFSDPDGHRIELHGRIDRSGDSLGEPGRRPVRLHHVTVTTPDVRALEDFYVMLGFVVSDRMGDRFTWLRCNAEHHTVAIVEGPPGGLDHLCFEIAGWQDLRTWCDELAARGVPTAWGPGRHGPGNNLFIMFDDPDGVHVELSCEMERFWDGRAAYPGPRTWTEDARTVNLWGPTPEWRRPVTAPA